MSSVGVATSGRAVVTRSAPAKTVAATARGAKMRATAPAAVRGGVKKGVVEALPSTGLRPLDEEEVRTYLPLVRQVVQRMLPHVLLTVGDVLALIDNALTLIARTLRRPAKPRSSPRPVRHLKPHPHLAYKG